MEVGNLNLARKWRSKNFDQIVGQHLSIKMLRNSLYLDRFFPVYLFSGQRGCGKTTTARVFAAAINCEKLTEFRKSPKSQLMPCNTCISCVAMLKGKHPDFIEMDAASHTGVENVRNIVDAASLLPIMGSKKVYLIDEAHMLSKAAFNAFLKILEEPPSSVIFILATTDVDKIIDTVKSRCFHLFFKPVNNYMLLDHLHTICSHESIKADDDALSLIIKETDGSVRDAINVLERVRFSSAIVDKKAVQDVLGHLDDEQVIRLLESILYKTPADLILYFKHINLQSVEASFVWRRLTDLLRTSVWLKNGVEPEAFGEYLLLIKDVIEHCSWKKLNHMLMALYANEEIFKRTTSQHSFLEMMLLGFCQKYSTITDPSTNNSSCAPAQASPAVANDEFQEGEEGGECDDEYDDEDDDENDDKEGSWSSFIQEIGTINDRLLMSIFKQAQFLSFDEQIAVVHVALSKDLKFFSDWIDDTEHLWKPVLQKYFGGSATIQATFTLDKKEVVASTSVATTQEEATIVTPKVEKSKTIAPMQNNWQQKSYQHKNNRYQSSQLLGKKMTAKDIERSALASMLMRHFPGDIYEIKES